LQCFSYSKETLLTLEDNGEKFKLLNIPCCKAVHDPEPVSFQGVGLKHVWLGEGFDRNHTNMKPIFSKFSDSAD
jgi:hypothetical protein